MKGLLRIVVAMGVVVAMGRSAHAAAPACGDVNADLNVDLNDGVHIIGWQLLGGAAPLCDPAGSCADVNTDGTVDIGDGVYLLNWLSRGGPAPQCPGGPQEIEGFTFIGQNVQGYPEYRHDQTGIVFVSLPGGKFNMGSPAGEPWREEDEGPVHEVTLSPFLMGKYELTQGQWHAVMGDYPSYFDGAKDNNGNPVDPPDDRDSLPVEQVSWDDIQQFEAKTGLGLPTEAQWEYAARAGTETAFSFGSGESCADWECAACPERDEYMWYCGNSGARTHEVGTKAANPFGLHDVHGNVWEWCEDVYEGAYYSKPEAAGPDPLSTSGSEGRVCRGGCWIGLTGICRSAIRGRGEPWIRALILGLRPALRPSP